MTVSSHKRDSTGEALNTIAKGTSMEDARAKLEWFKTVILPHQPPLRAYLRYRNDLDDLVAEALARAWANPEWRRIDRGRAYLFTIARNLVIDLARREKIVSFQAISDLDQPQYDAQFDAQLNARDQLRRLQTVVDQLPQQCRRVFILRRIQEKSFTDIAAEMDLTVSTIEKHLAKAIRLLALALADDGDCGFVRKRSTHSVEGGDRGEECSASRQAHPLPGRCHA